MCFFSDLGLALVIICYVIFGAYLFQYLENDAIIQKCEVGKGIDKANIRKYALLVFNFISLNLTDEQRLQIPFEEIKNMSFFGNITNLPDKNDPTFPLDEWLIELRTSIHNTSDEFQFTGQPCHLNSWIFESSILFTITLITTIGYGHITPITWDGQVVSMCFSIIGIPLFLLWISKLSYRFGTIFRAFYSLILLGYKRIFCHSSCCKRLKRKESILEEFESAAMNPKIDQFDSTSIFSTDSLEDIFYNTTRFDSFSAVSERVSIPLLVVLMILVFYAYIGTVVLNYLEGWNFTEAIYFSFVSISTIGFGDLVPGIKNFKNKSDSLTDGMRILYGVTYLIIGIAVIAMCYDLIQEDLFVQYTKLQFIFCKNEFVDDEAELDEETTKRITDYINLMKEKKEN